MRVDLWKFVIMLYWLRFRNFVKDYFSLVIDTFFISFQMCALM